MACAAAHDEQMENFMKSKLFPVVFKPRNFQSIDDAAGGIDQSSCKEPCKRSPGQTVDDRSDCHNAEPSHGDIHNGGNPFRASDPEHFK